MVWLLTAMLRLYRYDSVVAELKLSLQACLRKDPHAALPVLIWTRTGTATRRSTCAWRSDGDASTLKWTDCDEDEGS